MRNKLLTASTKSTQIQTLIDDEIRAKFAFKILSTLKTIVLFSMSKYEITNASHSQMVANQYTKRAATNNRDLF